MFNPTEEDYKKLLEWPMVKDPMAAVKDYSPLKSALRWVRPAQWRLHREYYKQRADWIGKQNFEKYFEEADRTIERPKWEFLRLRKSWYHIPLMWERFAGEDSKRVLDLGCGDGDATQSLIEFIEKEWQKTGKGHDLEIVGIDLGASRIKNAEKLVRAKNSRIKVSFNAQDAVKGLNYPDKYFDYSMVTGVIEIMEGERRDAFMRELCRVTRKGIYMEDLMDRYPGGDPQEDLAPFYEPYGFKIKKRHVIFTEPWSLFGEPDPCKLWPNMRDQIIWAERVQD